MNIKREVQKNNADWSKAGGEKMKIERSFPRGPGQPEDGAGLGGYLDKPEKPSPPAA
jgi:hypothetical protein